MTSAALGVLILWFGWFGFNPGSTMSAGNGVAIAHIAGDHEHGGGRGAIGATLAAWLLLRKPDLSMILNGCLAGLVAITAPCAFVSVGSGAIIGFIAGMLVVLGVLFFDKLKIDDPVGALSVHLLNGVFGTLAVGLFYNSANRDEHRGLATGLSPAAAVRCSSSRARAWSPCSRWSCPRSSGSPSRRSWACASAAPRKSAAWTSANTAWKPIRTSRAS